MLIVGLTGGIASGKSLVARVFRDLGAHVIDADVIVHGLLEPHREAWQEVTAYFGKEIITHDDRIDRRKLGEIIFNDADKRAWLNSCLHPRVFEVYKTQVHHLRDQAPDAVVVFDAALLIETGYHRQLDALVVVYAEREQQIDRLMKRDNLSLKQCEARIKSQMPLAAKRGLADYVISNTGTREEAERQAAEAFDRLKERSRRKE